MRPNRETGGQTCRVRRTEHAPTVPRPLVPNRLAPESPVRGRDARPSRHAGAAARTSAGRHGDTALKRHRRLWTKSWELDTAHVRRYSTKSRPRRLPKTIWKLWPPRAPFQRFPYSSSVCRPLCPPRVFAMDQPQLRTRLTPSMPPVFSLISPRLRRVGPPGQMPMPSAQTTTCLPQYVLP